MNRGSRRARVQQVRLVRVGRVTDGLGLLGARNDAAPDVVKSHGNGVASQILEHPGRPIEVGRHVTRVELELFRELSQLDEPLQLIGFGQINPIDQTGERPA